MKDPILHYKCNDNAANTIVIDSIGTYNGDAQRNTDLLSVAGKINNALNFNGVVGGQLIHHWKMNETSGTNVEDSKGSNDGTTNFNIEDNSHSVTGKINNAIATFTNSEKIELDSIIDESTITITFWVKQDETLENWDRLFEVGGFAKGGYSIQVGVTGTDEITFYLGSVGGWDASVTTSITRNVWTHIACTYNGTTMKIYKNGDLIDSDTSTYTVPTNTPNKDMMRDYNGIMDDIRVYSRDLDLNEVKSIYKSGNGTEDEEDYININTNIDLDPNNHSIAFWYKSSNSKFQMLFQRELLSLNSNIEFRPADNTIRVESYTNNLWDKAFSTGINIDDGAWHHYVLVFGPTYATLYTDGSVSDTETASDDAVNFRYRYIGGQGNNTFTYGQTPDGDFDDIRIYDIQLTTLNVEALYNSGSGTELRNPITGPFPTHLRV